MAETLRLALVQLTAHNTHGENCRQLDAVVARAAADGAEMLALPEAAGLMDKDPEHSRAQITTEAADPYIAACRAAAARHGLWIQLGSTPILSEDGRYLNHGLMIDGTGAIRARYDKIHLFDVFLEGKTPIGESKRYVPGDTGVVVDTPWGAMGLSICYDLRFPQLYRDYAQAGAGVLFVPSAFTVPTGRAHWEVLLRARAIETGAFVIAAAQVGAHADGRETWGHALAVSPWGAVLADLGGAGPGQVTLDLDLSRVAAARGQIPSLQNGREYRLVRIGAAGCAAGDAAGCAAGDAAE